MTNISIDNGKYIFRTVDGESDIIIDRGPVKFWVRIKEGSKAVGSLMAECQDAWQRIRLLEAVQVEELPGSDQELEREARATIRRSRAGIDGLDWDRRVLIKALQLDEQGTG